jgi:proline iminopeptidase
MAVRYPDRLSHLILIDTAAVSPASYGDETLHAARRQGATKEMLSVLQEDDAPDDEGVHRQLMTIWPLYWNNFGSEISRHMMDNCIFSVAGLARQGELQAFNMMGKLGEIMTPTLIVVGRNDFIAPVCQAQNLREGIPHSELAIFEQSGHFPFVEEAQEFFTCVRAWVGKVEAS